jgi:hypothetical protein
VPPNTDYTSSEYFLYVAFIGGTEYPQGSYANGSGAYMSAFAPYVAPGDDHSLAEIAILTSDRLQIAELGWIVGSDQQPRLFVFHWVNGQPTCYDGCGFVQSSSVHFPGMALPAYDTPREFEIVNWGGDWWAVYDGDPVGYFPSSLWGGNFRKVGQTEWFGEVAAAKFQSCTQMGDGSYGTTPGAASMSNLFVLNAAGGTVAPNFGLAYDTSPAYTAGAITSTGFSFGGPGACCTPSTCAALGAHCGTTSDNCGGILNCGTCTGALVCGASNQCEPIHPPPGCQGHLCM